MARIKIYLDTSAINFLFADDAPEKKEITIDLFENYIKTGVYDTTISKVVIGEIENTKESTKRHQLLNVLQKYPIEIIDTSGKEGEISALATKYIHAGIIPIKKRPDSLHVAISVIYRKDYLVSWNYQHLANIKKEQQVHVVNLKNNYLSDLRIITPLQLIYK